jgi:hypothetical protein
MGVWKINLIVWYLPATLGFFSTDPPLMKMAMLQRVHQTA